MSGRTAALHEGPTVKPTRALPSDNGAASHRSPIGVERCGGQPRPTATDQHLHRVDGPAQRSWEPSAADLRNPARPGSTARASMRWEGHDAQSSRCWAPGCAIGGRRWHPGDHRGAGRGRPRPDMTYRIQVAPAAVRQLRKLQAAARRMVQAANELLAERPDRALGRSWSVGTASGGSEPASTASSTRSTTMSSSSWSWPSGIAEACTQHR